MTESKYEKNAADERIVGEFLDEYFYPVIEKKYTNTIKSINRNFNVSKQNKGVDVILKSNNGSIINIDEKAATEHLNKGLPTFVLEIYFLKDEILKDGWLFGEKYSDTDTYLFCWIWTEDTDKVLSVENIKHIEAYSIRKSELKQLLNDNYGINKLNYKQKSKLAAKEINSTNRNVYLKGNSGPRWNISHQKNEKPITLVTPKHILKKVTKTIFNISKHEVKIKEL
ncbi:hypothetical protein [Mammaliicoccus sp. P-M56]|uniref:hypothetical protein n=1 Tax=Mammaliicoccus sp. P-M56 TaxID=2898715 RepID=UPI001EFAB4A5|nr:hypothetical protein [Mammaliicoccus sp. P-M56]